MRRHPGRAMAYLAITLAALAGCASYTPRATPAPIAGGLPLAARQGDVEVAADPYVDRERQKAVFDE
ncbi:MAG TPA: hypothetical protein VFX28_04135, partial [Methylomirabilota bacterium]|nr:hypothetical protein [Methylomirabilota bacterium]